MVGTWGGTCRGGSWNVVGVGVGVGLSSRWLDPKVPREAAAAVAAAAVAAAAAADALAPLRSAA